MKTLLQTVEWRSALLVVVAFAWMSSANASADLTKKYNCVACHAEVGRKVGPAYQDVAKKYTGRSDAVDYIAGKIRAGGKGVWGPMVMPPHSQVPEADARAMAVYVLGVK